MAKKVIIAYIPVIHEGYRRLFEDHPAFHTLYILGKSVSQAYRPLQKEIRALDPTLVRQSLQGWNLFDEIRVIEEDELATLSQEATAVLMPDEDISHDIAEQYFANFRVAFSPTFLRWDRRRSSTPNAVDMTTTITLKALHQRLMRKANTEGLRSSDIWRRVGALVAKNGAPLIAAANQSRPTKYSVWLDGDPRNNYQKGVGIGMSTAQHAESCVISEAARQGLSLDGADMYVTTFPCPPCAMLIAYSGIKRLFFVEGYAVLDGRRILEDKGVELIRVKTILDEGPASTFLPYPG